MKVFLINLPRSTTRLARVSARLEALGVSWERLEAIDDAELAPSERGRRFSAFGWWCCTLAPPVHGQIGCALSHQKAYRKIIEEGLPFACVLEDDVVLDDRFPEVLTWVESHLERTSPQVVLLCDHDGGAQKVVPDIGLEPATWDWCAEGYVLTRSAAEALLADNSPLRVMNDTWSRWVDQGVIRLFHARPTVCTQVSFDHPETSEIARCQRVCDLSSTGRFFWRVKRVIGVTLDALSSSRRFRGACVLFVRRLKQWVG